MKKGFGALAFASIPYVLGLAAVVWLLFFSGLFEFSHYVTTLNRADNRVGVFRPLRSPIELQILDKGTCLKITKAFLDGDTVSMYVKNTCDTDISYHEWDWVAYAPDGTVIDSNYDNSTATWLAGDVEEHKMDLTRNNFFLDRRITIIKVWVDR